MATARQSKKKVSTPAERKVTLRNPLTNAVVECTIVGEESILDTQFWVVQWDGRLVKIAKQAFEIVKG